MVVVATEEFEQFVDRNGLSDCIDIHDDDEIRRRFLARPLRPALRDALEEYLATHHRPIAVRSSSLHEDAFYQPLAGLFATYVLPNSHPDRRVRLRQLENAVKLVYASTYYDRPKRTLSRLALSPESELMAVVLQELVGEEHGGLFYPHATGVVQSLNFFPVGVMKPEDGIALMVMGLGSHMVRGGRTMRFCPRHPTIRPQIYTSRDLLRYTQRKILTVDLQNDDVDITGPPGQTFRTIPVEDAEAHGTLRHLASTWVESDQTLYPGTLRSGVRVVTFDTLLRGDPVPLPRMLALCKERFEEGFHAPVVFKFALKLRQDDDGLRGDLFLLQVRPMVTGADAEPVDLPAVPEERVILRSSLALGNGRLGGLRHAVYVPPEAFDAGSARDLAARVAQLNQRLEAASIPYILIGPGRWGSVNRSLGIPVTFDQIDGARVIVETALPGRKIVPSQGTHFFQNVAALRLFYLAVDPRAGGLLRREVLDARPDEGDAAPVRLITFDEPIEAVVDGRERQAMLYVPRAADATGRAADDELTRRDG